MILRLPKPSNFNDYDDFLENKVKNKNNLSARFS